MILDQKTKEICDAIVQKIEQPVAIIMKGESIISILLCEDTDLYNPGSHQYQDDISGIDITDKIKTNEFLTKESPSGSTDLMTYYNKKEKMKYSIRGFEIILISKILD